MRFRLIAWLSSIVKIEMKIDLHLRRFLIHAVVQFVLDRMRNDGQFITADSLKQEVILLLNEWVHDTHFSEFMSLDSILGLVRPDEDQGSS